MTIDKDFRVRAITKPTYVYRVLQGVDEEGNMEWGDWEPTTVSRISSLHKGTKYFKGGWAAWRDLLHAGGVVTTQVDNITREWKSANT